MSDLYVFVDPDPRPKPELDEQGILEKVEWIEEQLHTLRNDAYALSLANEVLSTQNTLLHEAHEKDRKEIVRLLRQVEALQTEQPEDEC